MLACIYGTYFFFFASNSWHQTLNMRERERERKMEVRPIEMRKSYPLTQIPQITIIDFERERERERETGHESETDRQTESVGYALNTCNKKKRK